MNVSSWIRPLRHHFVPVPDDFDCGPEMWSGNIYRVIACSQCAGQSWDVQTLNAGPRHAVYKAAGICSSCSANLEVFDVELMPWGSYVTQHDDSAWEEVACECGNGTFRLIAALEVSEEPESEDDFGWFWLFADCPVCKRRTTVVNCEID